MRIVVGLLACLSAAALSAAFADPPAASPPATPAPAATPASTASTPAPAAKPAEDVEVKRFLAEGYKPEMHHGQEVYCRKDNVVGSRLSAVKTCGTIEELKLMEQQTRRGVEESLRQQNMGAH
ncbi:MAG TPA: hypothetical protein VGR86_03660 [Steroidobacteraceae bacterium]|nr:hypothetical protein [Steroidobacteraceae bacterium]